MFRNILPYDYDNNLTLVVGKMTEFGSNFCDFAFDAWQIR